MFLPAPWVRNSGFQNNEKTNFYCFKPHSLWWFVRAAAGYGYGYNFQIIFNPYYCSVFHFFSNSFAKEDLDSLMKGVFATEFMISTRKIKEMKIRQLLISGTRSCSKWVR